MGLTNGIGLKSDNDDNSLQRIQVLLGLSTWSEDSKREAFRSYAWGVERERDNEDVFESLNPGDIMAYKQDEHFQNWSRPGQSAMLLIIGTSNPGQRRTHCWMSPLAIDIIRQHEADDMPHAFQIFAKKETDMQSAIIEILFQLLRWKRRALGENNYFAGLSAIIHRYNDTDVKFDEDAKVSALVQVVERVIQVFEPNETVHITLDRIDHCKPNQQLELMRVLIQMLETARCIIKLVAIAKDTFWEVDEASLPRTEKAHFKQVLKEQKLTI